MSDNVTEKLYTFAEAAERINRSEQTVHFFVKHNMIEATEDMISEASITDFLERSERASDDVARAFKEAPIARERLVRNYVLANSGVDSETATRLGYLTM